MPKGAKPAGRAGVGERHHEFKVAVVHVDFVVPEIGGVKQVTRCVAGNRQAGVDGARTGIIDADQRIVRIEVRPSADGAVERGEEEGGGPTVNLEFRRAVIDDAGGRTDAAAGSGRNGDHLALFRARAGVERGEAGASSLSQNGLLGLAASPQGLMSCLSPFLPVFFTSVVAE